MMEGGEPDNHLTRRSQRRARRRKELFFFIGTLLQAISIGLSMIYYGFYTVKNFWTVYNCFWFTLTFMSFVCWATSRIQLGALTTFQAKADRYFVTTGLYKFFRHPIYYFGSFAIFSYIMLLQRYTLLVVFVILIPFQIIRALREEKVLKEKFQERYIGYIRNVWF